MLLQLFAEYIDLFRYGVLPSLYSATYQSFLFQTTSTTTATPIPPMPGINWDDPAIIAAVIGVIGGLVSTIIAACVAVYQMQRSQRAEQELVLLRLELDKQNQQQEQEKQQKEAARQEMRMAQNNVTRAIAYRKALHVDPQISRMQILDMPRPLEVADIYVRVHVHEDTIMRYTIDPALASAAKQRDPRDFFEARHHYLEQRTGTAIDPDEAIRKYRRCVVVGDPGAGKTTLLKYLALALADGKYPSLSDLPIHVELNAFVYSEDRDVLDYAARRWEERYAFPQTEARSYMDMMLRDGKAILLLDALDETVVGEQSAQADASYQKAWNAVIRLATRYPQACIVVTVRKAGYQQHRPLDGFTVVEVMDFRQEDIHQFIENWFRCTPGVAPRASADDLMARLGRNPRIQELAANPLLLSLIVFVYEAQLDLPDRRAELYRECVDVLLTKWDAKRNIRRRRSFKSDHKRQLLTEVAWHFHQKGRRYFPEQDLLTEIAHFLPALGLRAEDSRQVLQEIANENGLLKEQARGWYGFLHLRHGSNKGI
jgi:predicted NACHT family NTPase